jgi:uncharacterized protein (TIGR02145 family)
MLPVLFAVLILAASQDPGTSVTDPRDGKSYPIVSIAGMTWMGRNLDYAVEGSSCPRGEPAACSAEGRLYPWSLAMKACPIGWHVSTEDEWQRLERWLGMGDVEITRERARGTNLRSRLEPGGDTRLDFPLAGWRRPDGEFRVGNGMDRAAAIWTGTLAVAGEAWHRDLSSARSGVWRSPVALEYSLSVRCVRD